MKSRLLLVLLLISLFCLALPAASFAQPAVPDLALNAFALDAKDVYQFPVKPNTQKWRSFQTHAEMLAVTQVPANMLQRISTEGLIETVLSYPLLMDIHAYNHEQQGFDAVKSRFNGLSTLLTRPDAGTKLLARYLRMDPAAAKHAPNLLAQGQISAEFAAVELLLAQKEVVATLTPAERTQLLAETLKKGTVKQSLADIYGQEGQEATTYAMAKVLQVIAPEQVANLALDQRVSSFLDEGSLTDVGTLNRIIGQAQQQLSQRVQPYVRGGGDVTILDFPGTVTTPRGTSVPVIVMTTELSAADITAANNYVASAYPNATRETNASRKYNCHSYAWHSTSTTNDKWMNTPGDDTYWNDGSYSLQTRESSDYRISYASDDHSAIVAASPTGPYMYRSKWGQLPRMYHAPNYTPYNSSVLKAYKRN